MNVAFPQRIYIPEGGFKQHLDHHLWGNKMCKTFKLLLFGRESGHSDS